MVFTPSNIIENIDKLGGWSAFGLAETAIFHYHPHIRDIEDSNDQILAMIEVSGDMTWQDWIIKYQTEVGYKSFHPDAVNEY